MFVITFAFVCLCVVCCCVFLLFECLRKNEHTHTLLHTNTNTQTHTYIQFGAFVVTGSGSMLSEGVHSLADTANQLLLYIGLKVSE